MRNNNYEKIGKKSSLEIDPYKFYLLTYGIAFASLGVALVVDSLGAVLALVGATGSTTISYILPGIFYYYSFKHQPGPIKYVALCMTGMGICIIPFALTMVFWSGEGA